MCDCKQDIEARLLDRFIESNPNAKEHSAKLTGYSLVIIENSIKQKGCMPIEMTACHPLKNGGSKVKTSRSNMIFNFCPFCGEKFDKEAAQ